MHANLGQHLTLLGLCALVFTLVMVASGKFPPEVLPQFLATVVIFLLAGRTLRADTEESRPVARRPRLRYQADWPWLNSLLNWTCALLLVGILAIALAKPVGVSFGEALSHAGFKAQEHYFAGAVP